MKYCKRAFFSHHFNIPTKQLSWGIIEMEDGVTPCLLIKDTDRAIDIFDGHIKKEDKHVIKRVFHAATFRQLNKTLYQLSFNINGCDMRVEFSEKNFEDIYKYRWFTPELLK